MTTTAQVLRDAKALIADPDHWIKGQLSTDTERGECFCLEGAVFQASGLDMDDEALYQHPALNALREVSGWSLLFEWNDSVYTTHADVMAAFDRAIAAEESA